jgi:hypothetical protein
MIGRVFKIDRQTVVGVVTAFEEWRGADHQARWARYARLVEGLRARLTGLPGVSAVARYFTMDERLVPDPVNSLVLELAGHRLTHAELGRLLAEGNPSIAADVQADRLIFCFDAISDDEVDAVGARLIHRLGI